jgi:exosortase/archaeosortase family protein
MDRRDIPGRKLRACTEAVKACPGATRVPAGHDRRYGRQHLQDMIFIATPPRFQHGGKPRLFAAAALLFSEYLTISVRVDAASAASRGGIWTAVAELGAVGPVIVTTAAAWFMISRLGTADVESPEPVALVEAEHPSHGDPRPVPRLPWLFIHALSFAALLSLSISMFGSSRAPAGPALVWFIGWCSAAALVFVSVLLGVLGGARWLRVLPKDLGVAGPLGLLAWVAGLASAATWPYSSSITLEPVASLLSRCLPLGSVAQPGARLLRIDHFILSVSPGCGGHEGYGVWLVLMAAYLVAQRKNLRSACAWLALPVGLLIVWAANVVRFASLSYLGVLFGAPVAVAAFHSKATWVLYCGLAVLSGALARRTLMRGPGS